MDIIFAPLVNRNYVGRIRITEYAEWLVRWFIALVFVILLQVVCLGQEKEPVLDFKSDYLPSTPKIKLEEALELTHHRYYTQYDGFQGAVQKRTNSLFGRYEQKYFDGYVNSSDLNPCEIDRFLTNYQMESWEFQYGKWWDRDLFDSYTPEKGGALRRVVVVGRETPMISYENIELTNTGHIKIGELGFGLEQFKLPPTSTVVSTPASILKQEDPPLSIRAFIPRLDYDFGWAKFYFYQNMTLRASLQPDKILTRLTIGLDGRFKAYGHTWAKLTVRFNYSPMEGTYDGSLWFELLTF